MIWPMGMDPPMLTGLGSLELEVVARECTVLGLQQPSTVQGVRVGRSGSLVVRLLSPNRRIILKITTAVDRLDRARLERRLIASPDLALVAADYVASADGHDAVTLATVEHDTLPHADAITDHQWSSLAAALGSLHRTQLPRGVDLPGPTPPPAAAVAASADVWAGRVTAGVAVTAEAILQGDPAAPGTGTAGQVLEHGDCHTENIVRDADGRFRWIDWQEARTGDGFSDLAFLWQRAEFAGARPPRAAMTQAYIAARGLTLDRDVRRCLDMAELRLLFLAWPPFLGHGSPASQRHLTDRLCDLTAALR